MRLVDTVDWEFIADFITIIETFGWWFVTVSPRNCVQLSVTCRWLLGVVLKSRDVLRVYLGVRFSDLRRTVLANLLIVLVSTIKVVSCDIAHPVTIWIFAFPIRRVAVQWVKQNLNLFLCSLIFWRALAICFGTILTSLTQISVMLFFKTLSSRLSLAHDLSKAKNRLVLK